jgi:hypothetical protein
MLRYADSTVALFVETADDFRLVPAFDMGADPLCEADDAEDVLEFAREHGIIVHTVHG